MKKNIKKKGLKKTCKDLRRDIKRLEQEKEKLIYELAELDDIKYSKLVENFEKNYPFIKKLGGTKNDKK